MKSVMKTTAGLLIVVIVAAPLFWLQFGWMAAVVVVGTTAAGVLGVGIWSAILEIRKASHRRHL